MGQKFRANERFDFDNGAIGWRPGGMMDCLGPFAKVQDCPVVVRLENGEKRVVGRYTCYASGYADTFFSIPASTRIKGKHIGGFFTSEDGGCEFNVNEDHRERIA